MTEMGGKSSKTEALSKTDLDWLVRYTKYNEETIQEWHKGFRRDDHLIYKSEMTNDDNRKSNIKDDHHLLTQN